MGSTTRNSLKGGRRPAIDGPDFMAGAQAAMQAGSRLGEVSASFAQALQHHQAGRLAEAEQLYRQILAVQPDHDESLHLLGVIGCQCGRADLAIGLIERAVALRGSVAAYHYNLGLARQMLGRLEAAAQAFEQALALQPDYAEACNNLGAVLLQLGRAEAAVSAFEQALALRPDHVEACCNLAVALQRVGRLDAAIARFEQALVLRPGHPEALYNLGLARERQGRRDAAVACLEQALAARPDYPDALYSLGAVLQAQDRLDAAAERYERAAALRPDHAETWYGLGGVRHRQGRHEAARHCYERAIALKPDYPDPYSNLSLVLKDRGDVAGAMAALDRALALKPDFADAQLNQAMIRLLTGDFARGWLQYESRWQTRQLDPDRRDLKMPRWDGADGKGGTMLVWAEQGLGDSLQFCRYVELLARRGWRVAIEVPDPLVRLLRSLGDGVTVLPIGGAASLPIACHCPMLSLPLLFGTGSTTIPAGRPYLAADGAAAAGWQARLAVLGPVLKVGLVWAGNPGRLSALHAAVDTRRSIPLERLAPLLAIQGVRFVSLQKDRRAGEEPGRFGIVDPMGEVHDFADTAAIIAALELVIAVDTSVVHLAGALGKPVWLLNRFDSCWRWLLERDDSLWYPTLRQFRQQAPGDWDGVVAAAAAALAERVAGRN